jgi:hypothetical protein
MRNRGLMARSKIGINPGCLWTGAVQRHKLISISGELETGSSGGLPLDPEVRRKSDSRGAVR